MKSELVPSHFVEIYPSQPRITLKFEMRMVLREINQIPLWNNWNSQSRKNYIIIKKIEMKYIFKKYLKS